MAECHTLNLTSGSRVFRAVGLPVAGFCQCLQIQATAGFEGGNVFISQGVRATALSTPPSPCRWLRWLEVVTLPKWDTGCTPVKREMRSGCRSGEGNIPEHPRTF